MERVKKIGRYLADMKTILPRFKKPGKKIHKGPASKDGYKIITPGGKPFKKAYLSIMLWFMGRAIAAASKSDSQVKKEFEGLPEPFRFCLKVEPADLMMTIAKDENGSVKSLGKTMDPDSIDVKLKIKHIEAAFLLFTFQESTAVSIARNRIVVDGDVPPSCAVVRILDKVEVLLLPKFIARLAVKRYPVIPPMKKYMGRMMVYLRAVTGI